MSVSASHDVVADAALPSRMRTMSLYLLGAQPLPLGWTTCLLRLFKCGGDRW